MNNKIHLENAKKIFKIIKLAQFLLVDNICKLVCYNIIFY